jgi:hypothetical protein
MDPWARAAAVMARGPGGVDAEYRIQGEGPPVLLRVVLEQEDGDMRGRIATVTAALVPADGEQIGRPERGDTITIGGIVRKVEQPMAAWRGWGWRLPFSRAR